MRRWCDVVILVGAVWAAGCAQRDGTDPWATWRAYSARDAGFSLYYPSPPLQTAPDFQPDHPRWRHDDAAPVSGGPDRVMQVEAWRDSSPCDVAVAERRALWKERGYAVEVEAYTSLSGRYGWRLEAEWASWEVREWLLDAGSRCAILSVWYAAGDAAMAEDVERMGASFAVRGTG